MEDQETNVETLTFGSEFNNGEGPSCISNSEAYLILQTRKVKNAEQNALANPVFDSMLQYMERIHRGPTDAEILRRQTDEFRNAMSSIIFTDEEGQSFSLFFSDQFFFNSFSILIRLKTSFCRNSLTFQSRFSLTEFDQRVCIFSNSDESRGV